MTDKVVVITGSSSGIGADTAKIFAEKKYKVVVCYNTNKKGGEETFKECKKHTESLLLHFDVTKDSSIKNNLKKILDKFKKIDILINNAGVIRWKNFEEQNLSDIEQQINVNYMGLVKTTSIFLPYLKKQKNSIIINIASIAGQNAYPELSVYCGTKFAVRGFTQALAQELPKNIKVYAVNPGLTATKMTGFRGVDPEKVAQVVVDAAEEKLKKKSGADIDVADYL